MTEWSAHHSEVGVGQVRNSSSHEPLELLGVESGRVIL